MIYRASHHPVIYPFFKLYAVWKIKRNFHGVLIKGEFAEKNKPILLVSNHISWWDGFWAEYLNIRVFHRKFYFMMLEEQLKKHIFFNKTGGYSIRKGSRSILETLNYTAELLNDNRNLVLIFPQGKLESLHNQNIRFEKGIEHIIKKTEGNIQILFLVNLVEYFSDPRPGLISYFKEYDGSDFRTSTMENEYNRFYSACVAENILTSGS
jgi:1-acyl-sn-glycerol-3-phosphate acyltransferase